MIAENPKNSLINSFSDACGFARVAEQMQRERDQVLSNAIQKPLPKHCPCLAWMSSDFSDDHLAALMNDAFMERARVVGLKDLSLNDNPRITARSLPVILRLIRETNIEKLDLSDTPISDDRINEDAIRQITRAVHQQGRPIKVVFSEYRSAFLIDDDNPPLPKQNRPRF